ncbi:hypothetical protein LBMAG45_10140 [Nitrospirota bacterium]|nr:hypothetical protein LBMAG45_10140 [Nitrospirota bacterium]
MDAASPRLSVTSPKRVRPVPMRQSYGLLVTNSSWGAIEVSDDDANFSSLDEAGFEHRAGACLVSQGDGMRVVL